MCLLDRSVAASEDSGTELTVFELKCSLEKCFVHVAPIHVLQEPQTTSFSEKLRAVGLS